MATCYCTYLLDQTRDAKPKIRLLHVFWDEAEAIDHVNRLSAFASSGDAGYRWTEAWVARRDPDAAPALTGADRELLEFARLHDALETERPISVYFSFIFNRPGARAACEELRTLGWPDVDMDEELTGDDCWHVYAGKRRLVLTEDLITRLRTELEDLAERHGGTFDGWNVTGGGGLRRSEIGRLAT